MGSEKKEKKEGSRREIKKDLMERGGNTKVGEKGVVVRETKVGKEKWKIIEVYANKEMKGMIKSLEQ